MAAVAAVMTAADHLLAALELLDKDSLADKELVRAPTQAVVEALELLGVILLSVLEVETVPLA